jgi:hypothetical protein
MSHAEPHDAGPAPSDDESDGSAPRGSKKPYRRPETVELGSVTKLTAGGSGGVPEGMSGMIGMN